MPAGNVIAQYDLPEAPNVGKHVLASNDPNDFGPRFGFAYSPGDSGRLVVRGGYGIFYSRPSTAYIGIAINAPPMYTVRRSPAGARFHWLILSFPCRRRINFPLS